MYWGGDDGGMRACISVCSRARMHAYEYECVLARACARVFLRLPVCLT